MKSVTNLQVAAFVAETGNLSMKSFQSRFTSHFTKKIVRWLDTLGIVERRGMGRFLNCDLGKAVKIIRNTPFEVINKKTGPKNGSRIKVQKRSLRFFVENDPSGHFKKGASWPAAQVWGERRELMPEPGEFAIGTQLRLYRYKNQIALYEMTTRGFMKVCDI